ncbi:calcium-binding protein P [Etheostoma spectabile]|uniref:calcium-binding protein P n=1 Tax=Etheostoma spectabile TaxID=54343 RepID=UPI0013AFEC0C|nr:calcium-binding protein P-like [Etheostoma spectabile]
MSFGFCVRVLVLSLLTFGQHAQALSYRSGGSNEVKPYFGFERSLKPASSENLKPATAPRAGSDRGYGRLVDGYSQEGSVSSYRPGPPIIQKPRQQTQQPLLTNSNAGVLTKAESPKTGDPMSGIASSYGIMMYASPQSESTWQPKPPQQLYQKKSQQTSYPDYPFKPQEPTSMLRPQQRAYPSKLHETSDPVRPQQRAYPDYLAKPQEPASMVRPQQRAYPAYPSKPQQPADLVRPQPRAYPSKLQETSDLVRPQPRAYPDYPSGPQQPADTVRPQQHAFQDYRSKLQKAANPVGPQQRAYPDNSGMFPYQGGVSSGSKPTDSNPKLNLLPRSSMASPDHPRWQQLLIPVPVHNRYH